MAEKFSRRWFAQAAAALAAGSALPLSAKAEAPVSPAVAAPMLSGDLRAMVEQVRRSTLAEAEQVVAEAFRLVDRELDDGRDRYVTYSSRNGAAESLIRHEIQRRGGYGEAMVDDARKQAIARWDGKRYVV